MYSVAALSGKGYTLQPPTLTNGDIYAKQVLGSFDITLVARIHLPKQDVCISKYR
jgi:hypothetical protein